MHRSLSLMAGLCLSAALSASAHFGERTDSLWGFVSRSDLVVIGTVVRSQRFEEKGHTTVPGALRLRVDEVLAGEAGEHEVGILVEGMHQPAYADAEQVLVFAEQKGGVLRSLQTRSEKIAFQGRTDPAIEAVRRYTRIAAVVDPARRLHELRNFTLELLESPEPRLHQDAVVDLSREKLLDPLLGDREIRKLGEIAIRGTSPLVVREGIAAKLGVLLATGRDAAFVPLRWLAVETRNPAVRVAALNALGKSGDHRALVALRASADARDFHVRLAATENLARFRGRNALDTLRTLAADPDGRIRFAATRALERMGGPEAGAALRAIREAALLDPAESLARAADADPEEEKGPTP